MEDKLINLEDMRSLFRKRLWIIIVVTALTTVLGIYKTRQMAPTYTCSMKFLVSTSDKILDNYSENEIEAYSKFMATFNEIMKVGDFLDDTLKKNKISKTSDQVKYAISYSVSTTAPIFTLNYTSSSTNEMEDILFIKKYSKKGNYNKLCLLSHFDTNNNIETYVIHMIKQLYKLRFDIVFVTTAENMEIKELKKIRPYIKIAVIKKNKICYHILVSRIKLFFIKISSWYWSGMENDFYQFL